MSITCTRRIQFCAGHRVMGHENKCAHLHGHNYVAMLTAESANVGGSLDTIGRVIDFSVLKSRLGGWIDENWDHGFILHADDGAAWDALETFGDCTGQAQKSYAMVNNPTAENMAKHLLADIGPLLLDGTDTRLVAVRIWETENCYADASL